jgi:hypothetical protein
MTNMTNIATNATIAIELDYSEGSRKDICYEFDTDAIIEKLTIQEDSKTFKSFDDYPPEFALSFVFTFLIVVFLLIFILPIIDS